MLPMVCNCLRHVESRFPNASILLITYHRPLLIAPRLFNRIFIESTRTHHETTHISVYNKCGAIIALREARLTRHTQWTLNETKKAQLKLGFFYYYLLPYFFGMSFKISNTNFQYFCAELICARSSGLCAPLIFGPKLIISISG